MILAGVLGDPVAHSRSPRLHGHWLARHGIDGAYVPLRVALDDLTAVLAMLPRMGFAGVNVTLPLKQAAFAAADALTDRARAAGAVNTLTFREGRIEADNTDGAGFIASLAQGAPGRDASAPALVLGAGGATRGVVAALLDDGAASVTVVNRTRTAADALAAAMGPRVRVAGWAALADAMPGHGLLVNTTSLGMAGHAALDIDLGRLDAAAVVADIVYTPLETPLLAQARARGLVAVDGLGMLLHQAVPGFEAWFGVRPSVDADLRAAVLA